MGYNVTVDVDKCVGCGECVDVCPVEVYEPGRLRVRGRERRRMPGAANPVWKFAKSAPSLLQENPGIARVPLRHPFADLVKVFIVPPGAHAPGGIFIGTSRFPAIPPHVFRLSQDNHDP